MTTTMSNSSKIQMAHELRTSIREMRDRGLLVGAKWASELLASLPKEIRKAPHLPFSPPPQPLQSLPHLTPETRPSRPSLGEFLPSPGNFDTEMMAGPSRSRIQIEEEEDQLDEDEFQLARGYFDLKELDRVVWTLRHASGNRAKFLRTYSAYLSADRKAQEALPHFLDTKEERFALYPALNPLIQELANETDPYLVYLRGLMLMRIDQRSGAIDCFVESIRRKPYNWSCWSVLGQLVNSAEMFIELKESLPSSPMLTFFAITVMLDLHTATDLVMNMIKELQDIFPGSVHLKAQRAMVYYHMRDFNTAEKEFDAVQKADRFRMEEVDIYSNMLYVMDKRAKLGKLAHEYAEIDRNRAEVCCLIGNYYSSRADHSKAITYFKRALMLNREYLPAWTLMGHEFVELKNSHAAIEAYRKAIDVNAKDYRAWYGLGQAYELLDMPMYAIEYYNQATSLRPYDCRMWTALATVYEGLQRLQDAIAAHTRALLGADRQQTPLILSKLATLHQTIAEAQSDDLGPGAGNRQQTTISSEAIGYHKKLLALGEKSQTPVGELAPSYLAVAEWEMWDGRGEQGDWALAAIYLEKVASSHTPQRDKAEESLRILRLKEARLAAAL